MKISLQQFLFIKVALLVGLAAACRGEESTNLLPCNVKDEYWVAEKYLFT